MFLLVPMDCWQKVHNLASLSGHSKTYGSNVSVAIANI